MKEEELIKIRDMYVFVKALVLLTEQYNKHIAENTTYTVEEKEAKTFKNNETSALIMARLIKGELK